MKTLNIGNQRGLTLVEVLIALVILTLAALGAASMQTNFGTLTADRKMHELVYNVADNAMSQCRAGTTLSTNYTDSSQGVPINVTVSGSCAPTSGSCSDVMVTAASGNDSITIPDQTGCSSTCTIKLCNF